MHGPQISQTEYFDIIQNTFQFNIRNARIESEFDFEPIKKERIRANMPLNSRIIAQKLSKRLRISLFQAIIDTRF